MREVLYRARLVGIAALLVASPALAPADAMADAVKLVLARKARAVQTMEETTHQMRATMVALERLKVPVLEGQEGQGQGQEQVLATPEDSAAVHLCWEPKPLRLPLRIGLKLLRVSSRRWFQKLARN
jgi:hypothetical protein